MHSIAESSQFYLQSIAAIAGDIDHSITANRQSQAVDNMTVVIDTMGDVGRQSPEGTRMSYEWVLESNCLLYMRQLSSSSILSLRGRRIQPGLFLPVDHRVWLRSATRCASNNGGRTSLTHGDSADRVRQSIGRGGTYHQACYRINQFRHRLRGMITAEGRRKPRPSHRGMILASANQTARRIPWSIEPATKATRVTIVWHKEGALTQGTERTVIRTHTRSVVCRAVPFVGLMPKSWVRLPKRLRIIRIAV